MPPRLGVVIWLVLFLPIVAPLRWTTNDFTREDMKEYRQKVKNMFYHAYNGYLEHAYPMDELKPISCVGQETWGSFSLTLVDALDTLLVMGNVSEFKRASELVLQSVRWDANVNVSVFETNIRVVGGLITAHMLSGMIEDYEQHPEWPCEGPLLTLAHRMAERLLPAFETDTGMPYGTVNLKYGVHKEETPITCTAGVGSFILEFGTLSRLTGDERFEKVAMRAMEALWKNRSPIGLVGNHINVHTAQWTATDAGIGAGVDSYFEYLVKGAFLFRRPRLLKQFYEYESVINKYVRKEDWFVWVSMTKATTTLPIFQSLEAFWPGILTMVGEVGDAYRIMMQYSSIVKKYGFPPEFYRLKDEEPYDGRAAFPLRPEVVESLMYLYRATRDPTLLQLGALMVDAIEASAKTSCGYATVQKVHHHNKEDRMESFFLAETTKYLYLLFDSANFLHNHGDYSRQIKSRGGTCTIEAGGYIFNTEAHPIDPGIVHCCSSHKDEERVTLNNFFDNEIASKSNISWNDPLLRVKIMALPQETRELAHSSDDKSYDIEFEIDGSFVVTPDELTTTEEDIQGTESDPSSKEGNLEKEAVSQTTSDQLFLKVEEIDNNALAYRQHQKSEMTLPIVRRKVDPSQSWDLITFFNVAEEEKPLLEREKVIGQVRSMLKRARFHDYERSSKGLKGTRLAIDLIDALDRLSLEMVKLYSIDALNDDLERIISKREIVMRVAAPLARCSNCSRLIDFKGDSIPYRVFMSHIYKNYFFPAQNVPFIMGPACFSDELPNIPSMYVTSIPDVSRYRISSRLPSVIWQLDDPEFADLLAEEWELLSVRGHSFEENFLMGLGQVISRSNRQKDEEELWKQEIFDQSYEDEYADEKRKEEWFDEMRRLDDDNGKRETENWSLENLSN